jgi:hypothetical protein
VAAGAGDSAASGSGSDAVVAAPPVSVKARRPLSPCCSSRLAHSGERGVEIEILIQCALHHCHQHRIVKPNHQRSSGGAGRACGTEVSTKLWNGARSAFGGV